MTIIFDDNYYKRVQTIFDLVLVDTPSVALIKSWHTNESEELQQFVLCNARIEWLTGIDVIAAVFLMVAGAYENDNIGKKSSMFGE